MWRSLPARVVGMLLVWQLLASAITIGRGFPYFGSSLVDNAPLMEAPIALWHYPAIAMLSASGYCCGLRNQLIFEAKVRGGHVALKPFGALLLAVNSWAFWSILAVLAMVLRTRLRTRQQPIDLLEESPEEEIPEGGSEGEADNAGHPSHQNLRQQ